MKILSQHLHFKPDCEHINHVEKRCVRYILEHTAYAQYSPGNVKGMMNVYKQILMVRADIGVHWEVAWGTQTPNTHKLVNTSKGAGYHISGPKLRFAEHQKWVAGQMNGMYGLNQEILFMVSHANWTGNLTQNWFQ